MKYKNILITGGAGFVGSNLALKIKTKYPKVQVFALDNLKRRGSELNIPRLKESGIHFIHGDVRQPSDFAELDKIDLIIECSAEPSVLAGLNGQTDYLIDTNLTGLINCLNFAKSHQADLFFLSTSRVYPHDVLNQCNYTESKNRFDFKNSQSVTGISAKGINEKFPLIGAKSLYGATKLAAELFIEEYRESFGIKTITNRFGCIAGPWQMGKIDQGVMALWIIKHIYKKPLQYIGYGGFGKQVRDFIHIDDVFEVIDKQIEMIDQLNGRTFNVGGGLANSVSLQQLTIKCQNITGNKIKIFSQKEARPADLQVYISDNSLIEKTLEWHPKKTVDEVIRDTYDWIIENQNLLTNIVA